MAVANIDSRDAAGQIQILLASVIVQVLQVAADSKERLLIVRLIEWEHVLLMQFPGLIAGYTLIGLRFIGGKPAKAGHSSSTGKHFQVKPAF